MTNMLLNMIREAVTASKLDPASKELVGVLENKVGRDAALRIVEGYQISPEDYTTWLDVITGYARDNGLNIKRKNDFYDIAFSVLENDPQSLDEEAQQAVVNSLWVKYKAQEQDGKVQKVLQAREEEEQLKYAIDKLKNRGKAEENEERSAFSQAYNAAFEDEEEFGELPDEFDPRDFDDLGVDHGYDNEDDIPFDDQEQEDAHILNRADQQQKSRDLENYDPASDEGIDQDVNTIQAGRQQQKSRDLEDYDPASQPLRSKPKTYYAAEQEEHANKYATSPFSKGQVVTSRITGDKFKVEIPDGPGDRIGILVDGRIKMVKVSDLESPRAREEEETTSNQIPKTSFLHDVLTGANSRDHLSQLQKQIEDEGANEWTRHHAKLPHNPHPKGSIAYKAWQRGVDKAAKEIWAPKPVLDPKAAKLKPKKK